MMIVQQMSEEISDSDEREQNASMLHSELMRHVFRMSDETRAKLLAFLHLAQDLNGVEANLFFEREGEIHLTLLTRQKPSERSRRVVENGAANLQ